MTKLVAAGALFKATNTGRYLFVLRSQKSSYPGRFGLVGGKCHINEDILNGLTRECIEELGFMPEVKKWIAFNKFESMDKKFTYHSVLVLTPKEFVPYLNKENDGYAWVSLDNPPKPLHPRLKEVLSSSVLRDCIKKFH